MVRRTISILLVLAWAVPAALGQGISPADSPEAFSGSRPALTGPKFAVKSNALYWASATPNLGLEVALGRRTTLDIVGGWNPFTWSDNKKWKHWLVQPGIRFWTCERFNGHFVGAHLHGGEFNVGGVGPLRTLKDNRYEGWFYGAGVSYGHQWILSSRWSFELEAGVGYARMRYDKYPCEKCGPRVKSGYYNYFGPTKLSATFMFFLW